MDKFEGNCYFQVEDDTKRYCCLLDEAVLNQFSNMIKMPHNQVYERSITFIDSSQILETGFSSLL